MTRDEKKVIIDGLTEKFKENPFFYITDASGFSVAQVNAFNQNVPSTFNPTPLRERCGGLP